MPNKKVNIPICNITLETCPFAYEYIEGLRPENGGPEFVPEEPDFVDRMMVMLQSDCLGYANDRRFAESDCPWKAERVALTLSLTEAIDKAKEQEAVRDRELAAIEAHNEELFRNA